MQIKVVIATVAFMLTMMILGFAALREDVRLEEFTHAELGRSIETGAELFVNNCATCHGVEGKAQDCGEEACKGLPLNDPGLLCGDQSARMQTMGWIGTKHDFIQTTISSGRPGYVMPAWLNEFGGPMRADQVVNLANYVLNWESEELCAEPVYQYEWQATYAEFSEAFPDGTAEAGKEAFLANGCNACHGIPDEGVAATLGPNLTGIAERGAKYIDGYSAEDYIYESVLDPNAFIAPDCPNGPCAEPSVMTGTFASSIGDSEEGPQELQDIIQYLLSLE